MKAVFGLGNPGKEYEGTRHNIGFIVLDDWAYQHGQSFDRAAFDGVYFDQRVHGEKVLFVKPTTYMNLSGRCVSQTVRYYKLCLKDFLIVYDDMDMEPGRIRLRKKGSSGGHNGIKSIISDLGTEDFQRLKLGTGHPKGSQSVVNYVLSTFDEEEKELMLNATKKAEEAIDYWLAGNSFEKTMSEFNH